MQKTSWMTFRQLWKQSSILAADNWVQVVNFNITDPDTNCPTEWMESTVFTPPRICGRPMTGGRCFQTSFRFPDNDPLTFQKVCGRVRGYAYGGIDGFEFTRPGSTINSPYVSGLILTADNAGSVEHLWTFAAGLGELGRTSEEGEIADQCPCQSFRHPCSQFRGKQLLL